MIFDYVTGSPNAFLFPIYRHLVPANELGILFMILAIIPAIAIAILQFKISKFAIETLIVIAAITAFLGSYMSSCRWLDDMFVNLAHSYNLFHHGRFSVSGSHMVNGTVEFLYYFLLTPFAVTETSLIVANYWFGFVIGLLHLLIFARLLRSFAPNVRLICLLAFSITIPLIQTFSGGYGNGLVSLVDFVGMYAIIKNRCNVIYACCALLPALRPDAALYSVALIFADLIINRRVRPHYWLPTVFSIGVYFLIVKLMYGDWIPTPMLLKSVSVSSLVQSISKLPKTLVHFFGNPFNFVYTILLILFFVMPKRPGALMTKKMAIAWFVSVTPILIFYLLSSQYGYNPASMRYYVGFQLMLTVIALTSIASIFQRGLTKFDVLTGPYHQTMHEPGINKTLLTTTLTPHFVTNLLNIFLSAGLLVIVGTRTVDSLKNDDGKSIGIQVGIWDMERLSTLAFAGRYSASVIPANWRIASTEMDTFGLFSRHEILDLWGYSNREIAKSNKKNRFGIKYNAHTFLDSNVEVFWVRTIGENSSGQEIPLAVKDIRLLQSALINLPNLSTKLDQAGNLNQVFQKYDVVRISHAHAFVTVYLIRKDLTQQFRKRLEASGHTLVGSQVS